MEMQLNRAATERSGTERHEFIKKLATLPSFLSRSFLSTTLALTAAGFLMASGAQAALTPIGDFYPSTPDTWTSSTIVRVGNSGSASLTVDDKFVLASGTSYLGYAATATGSVTVTGSDSTWTSSKVRYVGYNGTGVLNITNGGKVSNSSGYLGYNTGSTGTATVDGSGSAWINNGANLYVGRNGTGTLNITNGGSVNDYIGYIGYNANSSGTVTVDGADSTWTSSGSLNVGMLGTGVLNIFNGATVSSTGTTCVASLGTVNFGVNGGTLRTGDLEATQGQFTGAGTIVTNGFRGDADFVVATAQDLTQSLATWNGAGQNITRKLDLSGAGGIRGSLVVGYQNSGSLAISNGLGVVSSDSSLGNQSGSTGTAFVDGPGSSWSMVKQISVGTTGTGALNITNGGNVSNTIGYIGQNTGANGTVTVDSGAKWTNSAELYVGYTGTGTLNIRNGGNVSNTSGYIGYNTGSNGTVTVDGSGSKWDSGSSNINIGWNGTGALNITNGGAVTTANSSLGYYAGATGTVTVDGAGSSFTAIGNIGVGSDTCTGTLNILNGSTVSALGETRVRTGSINFGSSGGTLTTGTLTALTEQITGTGTINTKAWSGLGNLDMVFDSNHGLIGTATVSDASRNLAINYDLSAGDPNTYVGYTGNGTLTIKDGFSFNSVGPSFVGYGVGTTGTATVTGANSKWTVGNMLRIGASGAGNLNITDGGTVSGVGAYLGYNTGSTGVVTVSGADSKWINTPGAIWIGINGSNVSTGTGVLNIFDGATVTAGGLVIGTSGTVNFGTNGGTLKTGKLTAASSQFTGTGTVITSTFLGDANLVVGTAQDLTQTLGTWNGAGQNIAYKLDLSGADGLSGDLAVGYQNSGSLAVSNGMDVVSAKGYVGYQSGSTGTVSVDGPGSSWTMNSDSSFTNFIGYNGNGTLTITNGGTVTNEGASIGYAYGATGAVKVDGAGSKWITAPSFAQIQIGNYGTGSLAITNGGSVTDSSGAVAANGRSAVGSVIVDGDGSTWTNTQSLGVGNCGVGTLAITNGGSVTAGIVGTSIGYACWSEVINGVTVYYSTEGRVTVNGADSKLTSGGALTIGGTFSTPLKPVGRLAVTDGGAVAATGVSINTVSSLTADVGRGSSLKVGTEANSWTGAITNNGKIQLTAGAGVGAGTYTPISYGTMSGTGTVQALGGVWDGTAHTVAVNAASTAAGNGGSVASFNTATTQRALVTDSATGKSVGAGFQAGTSDLTFGATAINGDELTFLQAGLTDGDSILSGWDFTSSGYTSGDSVYLSLWVGGATSLSDMTLWKYDTDTWIQYTGAFDLAYDGTYASFTATDLNTWAVTGTSAVPVPGAVWLLGSGLLGVLGFKKRGLKV